MLGLFTLMRTWPAWMDDGWIAIPFCIHSGFFLFFLYDYIYQWAREGKRRGREREGKRSEGKRRKEKKWHGMAWTRGGVVRYGYLSFHSFPHFFLAGIEIGGWGAAKSESERIFEMYQYLLPYVIV